MGTDTASAETKQELTQHTLWKMEPMQMRGNECHFSVSCFSQSHSGNFLVFFTILTQAQKLKTLMARNKGDKLNLSSHIGIFCRLQITVTATKELRRSQLLLEESLHRKKAL